MTVPPADSVPVSPEPPSQMATLLATVLRMAERHPLLQRIPQPITIFRLLQALGYDVSNPQELLPVRGGYVICSRLLVDVVAEGGMDAPPAALGRDFVLLTDVLNWRLCAPDGRLLASATWDGGDPWAFARRVEALLSPADWRRGDVDAVVRTLAALA